MRNAPLRIAVAGLGRIGWGQHALSLAKHADFHLAAVSDTEAERRAEAETDLGCRAFESFGEMLRNTALDAVVIATPTHLHKPMALAALRRGLHVLLEKPMALNAREAAAIVRAARTRRRILTVYQPHRAAAYFQHLRRILATGKIGPVVRVTNALFGYLRRNDWQALRRYGGGMLSNYGAHGLDQILQIAGYDVCRVFCHMQRVATLGDAEDTVKIVLQTRAGIVADMDISQASTIAPYRLIVWGTCGAVSLEGRKFRLRYFDPKTLKPLTLDRRLASAGRRYSNEDIAYIEETIPVDPACAIDVYADFAHAIRTGAEPLVKPEEPLAVMRLIDRCRASARTISDFRLRPRTPRGSG